jgi:hypothetical protein
VGEIVDAADESLFTLLRVVVSVLLVLATLFMGLLPVATSRFDTCGND